MREKLMNAIVTCERNKFGTIDFYMTYKSRKSYLFTTSYDSYAVYREYSGGKRLADAFRKTPMFRQSKLRERLLRMAKYCSGMPDTIMESGTERERRRTDCKAA